MNITSVNNVNFGLLLPPVPAQLYKIPEVAPAIVQHVQISKSVPKAKYFLDLPLFTKSPKDTFYRHEAILPDNKIRIVTV